MNPVRTLGYGLDKRSRKVESRGITGPASREQVTARLKTLREYPWSSYRTYAGYESGPQWLTTTEILRRTARRVDARRAKYRNTVQGLLSGNMDESRLEKFRDVVGIGSAEFIENLKRIAGEGFRETERRGRLRERIGFEQVVSTVADLRGAPSEMWMDKHGDWGKWLVLRLARRCTGMTLRQLGEQMGGVDYAAIGMGLRRFDRRLKKDRKLAALCARASHMLDV